MSDFATRFGYRPPKIELDEKEMPDSLRAGLWDLSRSQLFEPFARYDFVGRVEGYSRYFDELTRELWFHVFRKSVDDRGDAGQALEQLRRVFLLGEFYEVYELIEYLCQNAEEDEGLRYGSSCNQILEREHSQFRFAQKILVKISAEQELAEVEQAMSQTASTAIGTHILRAAELYSDSRAPDYRNSIKESISAVEAAVAFVSGKKSGGISKPLRQIGEQLKVHPALRDGFEKIYAYTSDADGIRHALMDETSSTIEDAKFMLVACSGFANYLLTKHSKL